MVLCLNILFILGVSQGIKSFNQNTYAYRKKGQTRVCCSVPYMQERWGGRAGAAPKDLKTLLICLLSRPLDPTGQLSNPRFNWVKNIQQKFHNDQSQLIRNQSVQLLPYVGTSCYRGFCEFFNFDTNSENEIQSTNTRIQYQHSS